MLIKLPASLVIDDRLIVGGVALIGAIAFLVIFARRIWRAVKRAANHQASSWKRTIVSVCAPIILAIILAIAAALIWPRLGIPKDSFQSQIDGVPLQVDGAAGVFTVVYLGALTFFSRILPSQRKPPPDDSLPPVRVREVREGWPPPNAIDDPSMLT